MCIIISRDHKKRGCRSNPFSLSETRRLVMRCFKFIDRFGKFWQYFEGIAYYTVIGSFEERRFPDLY